MIVISLKTAFSKYLPLAQWGFRISKWLRFPVGHIVSAIRAARGDKYGCTWVNVINTPECEAQTLSRRGGGSLLGCACVSVCMCGCKAELRIVRRNRSHTVSGFPGAGERLPALGSLGTPPPFKILTGYMVCSTIKGPQYSKLSSYWSLAASANT